MQFLIFYSCCFTSSTTVFTSICFSPISSTFVFKATIGKTFEGKRIQKSFYGTSKLDAKKKADEYILQQKIAEATNDTFIKKNYTFGEWSKKWLNTYKKDKVQLSTYKAMEQHLKKYILPYFKKANINNIRPIDVQTFFDSHLKLSSSVKVKLRNLLNGIFETAIDNDLCYKNPARGVKLPTYTKVKEKNVYSDDEQTKIIKYIKEHDISKDVAILLKTGLRRGEMLALLWSDIDFDNKTISINKALKDTSGIPTVGEPKTKAGNRTIIFDDELKGILLSVDRHIKYKKNDKTIEFDCDYVVHFKFGNMYLPTNWSRRAYKPLMDKIVKQCSTEDEILKKLSPHELRHSYGTSLYNKGVDLRTIQKIMGHADLNITSNLYVHDNIEIMRKALKYD
ncbi:MAG: site-specific integrase [Oscillospiraceae bacterium]